MALNIEARLLQRSVFFTGETLHCEVSVTYLDPRKSKHHQSNKFSEDSRTKGHLEQNHVDANFDNSNEEMTVAWASAQIYCQCHINESQVKSMNNIKGQSHLPADMVTSFVPTRGETGHCFLSTKPVILFCNLRIQKGQSKKFIYTEEIPTSAPSSYRGQAVRFSYKITIGIGSIKGPTRLIRLPIRIIQMDDLSVDTQQSYISCDSRNPFIEDTKEDNFSLTDRVVDQLTFMSSQRNNNVYNISCSQGSAGKFSLSKVCYRIGEDLQGSFDFTDATVRCIRYKLSLQSEEEIMEKFQKQGIKQKTQHTTYSRYEECCVNCRQTSFSLPIPITATPEFTSKVVSVRWRLHCEVTTSSPNEAKDEHSNFEFPEDLKASKNIAVNGLNAQPPPDTISKDVKVETMTWDIPVRIVASNPIQISLMSLSQLSVSETL